MNPTVCTKCTHTYNRDYVKGEVLEDSEDNFVWYCNICAAEYIRPAYSTRPYDSCQWCKKPLAYKERLPFDIVLLHLDCYSKILDVAGEAYARGEAESALSEEYTI